MGELGLKNRLQYCYKQRSWYQLTSWADFSTSPLLPFFSFFFRKISCNYKKKSRKERKKIIVSWIILFKNKQQGLESTIYQLTTRNSRLSTIWLPSASNMLKAILKPAWGSKKQMQKECYIRPSIISCSTNVIKQYNV